MSKKINIIPLHDKVLLQEVKVSTTKTASGIILPDSGDKDTRRGKVVAVGAGRYEDGDLIPMTVQVGDEVLYSWGDKILHEGVEYTLIPESNIAAIIK